MYHFDFYRFKDQTEWLSSGFREYFNADSVCLVEWPERAGTLLAPPDLDLALEFAGEGRRAILHSHSRTGELWLLSFLSRA